MEITARSLWTLIHGMGFGALYLMACSGVIVELYRRYSPQHLASPVQNEENFLRIYLVAMAALAWLAWPAVLVTLNWLIPAAAAVPNEATAAITDSLRQIIPPTI